MLMECYILRVATCLQKSFLTTSSQCWVDRANVSILSSAGAATRSKMSKMNCTSSVLGTWCSMVSNCVKHIDIMLTVPFHFYILCFVQATPLSVVRLVKLWITISCVNGVVSTWPTRLIPYVFIHEAVVRRIDTRQRVHHSSDNRSSARVPTFILRFIQQ